MKLNEISYVKHLAHLAHLLHVCLCTFLCLGFVFSQDYILMAHLSLCVLIPIHWLTNKGRCILTEWTQECQNRSLQQQNTTHTPFVKQLFLTVGYYLPIPQPSDNAIKALAFLVPILTGTISMIKLLY
ncbi:MAG: DUF2784 family protein [Proteobacteria bacterium]|nr:DUF2784 family protein [Pseudomonadota bacterium]